MPGRMCPLKKHRNVADLPLALNPMKSKDVLAVLAERNQAVVPVGAWVEPASPNSYEIPAYVSVSLILTRRQPSPLFINPLLLLGFGAQR